MPELKRVSPYLNIKKRLARLLSFQVLYAYDCGGDKDFLLSFPYLEEDAASLTASIRRTFPKLMEESNAPSPVKVIKSLPPSPPFYPPSFLKSSIDNAFFSVLEAIKEGEEFTFPYNFGEGATKKYFFSFNGSYHLKKNVKKIIQNSNKKKVDNHTLSPLNAKKTLAISKKKKPLPLAPLLPFYSSYKTLTAYITRTCSLILSSPLDKTLLFTDCPLSNYLPSYKAFPDFLYDKYTLPTEYLLEYLKYSLEEKEEVKQIARLLSQGAIENLKKIDDLISKHLAASWKLSRINKVVLAVARLATYELLFCLDTDIAVIINEAVDITRDYTEQELYKFTNALLDNLKQYAPVRNKMYIKHRRSHLI